MFRSLFSVSVTHRRPWAFRLLEGKCSSVVAVDKGGANLYAASALDPLAKGLEFFSGQFNRNRCPCSNRDGEPHAISVLCAVGAENALAGGKVDCAETLIGLNPDLFAAVLHRVHDEVLSFPHPLELAVKADGSHDVFAAVADGECGFHSELFFWRFTGQRLLPVWLCVS